MRRRLKVHGATRRPRRKSEWLAGASGGCLSRLNVIDCSDVLTDPDLFTLVLNPSDATPGQVESVAEVTIARLVGELWVYSAADAPAATAAQYATVSFYVGVYIADASVVNFTILDPEFGPDMSSKDWMYRGLVVHTHNGPIGAISSSKATPMASPGNDHGWDIRVKRKIRKEEAIFLAIKAVKEDIIGDRLSYTAGVYGDVRALALLP